jgi:hypothetical protein
MDIHDAVDAIVVLLKLDIILDSSQVIADVLLACGPGAGEDTTLFQPSPPQNIQLSVTQNESEGKVRKAGLLRMGKPSGAGRLYIFGKLHSSG